MKELISLGPVPLLILSYLVLHEGKQSRTKLVNLFWPYDIHVPKELSFLGRKLYFHLWEAWKTRGGEIHKQSCLDLYEDIGLIEINDLTSIKQQLGPIHKELKKLNFSK